MTQYREPLFLLGHARLLGWRNNKGGYKNITVYFELWPINERFLSGKECKAFSVIVYHVVDEFKMDRYFSKLAWKFQSLYQSNLLGRGVCCVKITKDTLLSQCLSPYTSIIGCIQAIVSNLSKILLKSTLWKVTVLLELKPVMCAGTLISHPRPLIIDC